MKKKSQEYKDILKRLDEYSHNIHLHYYAAIREMIKLYRKLEANPDKSFQFSDHKSLSPEATKILQNLYSKIYNEIKNGIKSEWNNANDINDKLIKILVTNIDDYPQYFQRNEAARQMYTARVGRDGLNLSQRIWRNVSQFKEEIEMAFDVGLSDGRSAAELSRDIRKYLNEPEKLFRRVRDTRGNLQLSKNAKAYNPGQGVYRSSYKNSMRVARTEINMAYRNADILRWQQLDFVVGYEVHRSSTNPYECPICEQLQGKYPKSFIFTGWHPQCRCYVTPVMMTQEEFVKVQKQILKGEKPNIKSKNEVRDLPDGFKRYIQDNKDRIQNAKSLPYFIKDNISSHKSLLGQFKRYEFSVETAKKLGYSTSGNLDAEFNKVIRGFDLSKFDKDLVRLTNKYGIRITDKRLYASPNEITMDIVGKDNFRMQRTFSNGTAYHDNLTIPQQIQGKGFSKDLFRSLYQQYRNAGITNIEVQANINVGGYSWAKYGFSAKSEFHDDISSWGKWQLSEKNISQSNYNDFSKWMERYKGVDIPMWQLAEKKYGKNLLLGSNWKGVIDLTNSEQRHIFENYLSIGR